MSSSSAALHAANSTVELQPDYSAAAAEAGRATLADLLRSTRVYDVMPESCKVVVFDTSIPVRLAFFALLEHDALYAPLWDSQTCSFAGMLTMSDIVDIMRVFYLPSSTGMSVVTALSELTIAAWRNYARNLDLSSAVAISAPDVRRFTEDSRNAAAAAAAASAAAESRGVAVDGAAAAAAAQARVRGRIIAIDPEDDLFAVSKKLRRHRIHHMTVLDVEQNTVVGVVSHRSMLSVILSHFFDERRLFDHSIFALGIGSFDNVVVVPDNASIISVLNVLVERQISSVPVVNAMGQVVDAYGLEDIGFLANDPSLMVLDAPVGEVRRAQVAMMGPAAPLVTINRSDSLKHALSLFAAAGDRCLRLICIDEHGRCTGVVSLADIFKYICSAHTIVLNTPQNQAKHEEGAPASGIGLSL